MTITMTRDEYPDVFHSQPPWDSTGKWRQEHFFSAAGARWVRSLVERGVDVQWCTTWQEHANRYFAGPLGLPQLPVVPDTGAGLSETSAQWKARNIAAATAGRPVLWVDDRPGPLRHHRGRLDRTLTYVHRVTDPHTGITAQDVAVMSEWLELVSSREGQGELRRRQHGQMNQRRRQRIQERWGTVEGHARWVSARAALTQAFPSDSDTARYLAALARAQVLDIEELQHAYRQNPHPDDPSWSTVLRLVGTLHRYRGGRLRAATGNAFCRSTGLTQEEKQFAVEGGVPPLLPDSPEQNDHLKRTLDPPGNAGGVAWASTGELASKWGVSASTVRARRARGEIIADATAQGLMFPVWQFDHTGRPLPGLHQVLLTIAAPGRPTKDVTTIMTTPWEELDGTTPVDWLQQGRDLTWLLDLLWEADNLTRP
ncbi:hypothetical protein [Microbacterium sp. Marseille-Q6648]|uniref:hypothetical protein n=1 Tax=Microbacterium sp. Marseille-Q6648 TaxID=2937991 RepID=UPI00203B9F30|nr:hypothetical protein [Microbacterium sp. Marseille-Q6648]